MSEVSTLFSEEAGKAKRLPMRTAHTTQTHTHTHTHKPSIHVSHHILKVQNGSQA